MKREDISKIFEGATKEQIDALLDINSADIGKAKQGGEKLQGDIEQLTKQLEEARQTITSLEANKGNVEELQKQIDEYKAADARREQEAKEAAERAELEQRFNAVSGDRQYIHEMVRAGVMNDFGAAIKDKANLGKGDKEIFEALTKDKGYFSSQNPPAPLQPPVNPLEPLSPKTRDEFLKMSFNDQMRFKAQNETAYRQIVGLPPQNE